MGALARTIAFFVAGKACDLVLKEQGSVVLERVRLKALATSGRLATWVLRKKMQVEREAAGKTTPKRVANLLDVSKARGWWWQADLEGRCVRPVRLVVPSEQPPLLKYFRRPRWMQKVSFSGIDGMQVEAKNVFENPEDAAKRLQSQL